MSERWAVMSETTQVKPVVQATTATGPIVVVCPGMALSMPSPESWQAIYRMAYEQARLALAPSRFQRQLEPSRN